MSTFILLTRLGDGAVASLAERHALERGVKAAVAAACPDVEWLASFAVSGPYDYLDILDAPDSETAIEVSTLVKTMAGGTTDTWVATDWKAYKNTVLRIAEDSENSEEVAPDEQEEETSGDVGTARFADLPQGAITAIAALRPTEAELETAWSVICGNGSPETLGISSKAAALYWIIAQQLPQRPGSPC